MSAFHIAVEVGFILVAFLSVAIIVRAVSKAEHRMGFDAFHDGLSFNPKWSKHVRTGWRDAREDAAVAFMPYERKTRL